MGSSSVRPTKAELPVEGSGRWSGVLGPSRGPDVVHVARQVAARVTDPHRLEAAIVAAGRQTRFPETVRWDPFSIAEGDAGVAMLCSYLDACFPDEGWDEVGHRFLSLGVHAMERRGIRQLGLFSGLSGLAFAATSLGRDGLRYQRLLAALDGALLPSAVEEARVLGAVRGGTTVGDWDLISGITGVGAYLLSRGEVEGARTSLESVVRALVELLATENGLPRWWTPPGLLSDESMVREFPYGNLNCGLAHGAPGPLALLALALREGVEVSGQASAVRRSANWLVEHRVDDAWGVNWPSAVPVTSSGRGASGAGLRPTRSAWCYGSPGVARSLWLAGDVLGDSHLCSLATEAMEAVFRRPVPLRNIDSPTFCHGVAGLLQITLRFAEDTGLEVFTAGAETLVDQLLSAYQPRGQLGYVSIEPDDNPVDRAGLLDGAAGVAGVLLAAATDVEPKWDRLFLLA